MHRWRAAARRGSRGKHPGSVDSAARASAQRASTYARFISSGRVTRNDVVQSVTRPATAWRKAAGVPHRCPGFRSSCSILTMIRVLSLHRLPRRKHGLCVPLLSLSPVDTTNSPLGTLSTPPTHQRGTARGTQHHDTHSLTDAGAKHRSQRPPVCTTRQPASCSCKPSAT